MILFLDTSVLLAAAGSALGASRELFRLAPSNAWTLVTTPYILNEVTRNLPLLAPTATTEWAALLPNLVVREDVLTLDKPVVFEAAKDRPILFGALAWAQVLPTLDRADFGPLLGQTFYGLLILRPGTFLERERAEGRLR